MLFGMRKHLFPKFFSHDLIHVMCELFFFLVLLENGNVYICLVLVLNLCTCVALTKILPFHRVLEKKKLVPISGNTQCQKS